MPEEYTQIRIPTKLNERLKAVSQASPRRTSVYALGSAILAEALDAIQLPGEPKFPVISEYRQAVVTRPQEEDLRKVVARLTKRVTALERKLR